VSILNCGQRQLHYQLFTHHTATAPLVIYLHGLLMDNLSSGYFTFTHHLKDHAHVLLYDLVGHGRSSFVSSGYRLKDHYHDLDQLLSTAQAEIKSQLIKEGVLRDDQPLTLPVILVGCSFGGTLALYTSTKLNQVHSVVLLEGHTGTPQFLTQLTDDLSSTGERAENLVAQHFQHWLHRSSERKRTRLLKRSERLIYESSLLQDLREDATQSMEAPSLDMPILYMYGSNSDAMMQAQSLYRSRQDKGGRADLFKSYEGHTHALLWEKTSDVTDSLIKWIKGEHLGLYTSV
jgi:pimeloyl-ACP methyl ester carboxylesterase